MTNLFRNYLFNVLYGVLTGIGVWAGTENIGLGVGAFIAMLGICNSIHVAADTIIQNKR